jgi:hypothetical protein
VRALRHPVSQCAVRSAISRHKDDFGYLFVGRGINKNLIISKLNQKIASETLILTLAGKNGS